MRHNRLSPGVVLGNGPPTIYYPENVHQGLLYIDESTGTLYVFWNCNWVQITNPGAFSFNIEVRETAGGPAIHGPLTIQNGQTLAFFGQGNTVDFSLTPGSVIVGQTAISVNFGSGVPSADGLKTGDVYFDTTNNNVYRWNALGAWVLVYSLPSAGATGPTGASGATGAPGKLTTAQIFVSESDTDPVTISTNTASPTRLFDAGTIDVVAENGITFSSGEFTIVTEGVYLISTSVTFSTNIATTVSSIMAVTTGSGTVYIPSSQATSTEAAEVKTLSHTFQVPLEGGSIVEFFTLATGAAQLVANDVGAFTQDNSYATVSMMLIADLP